MSHYVTCTICKQRFDRDKEDVIAVSARRYAHKLCFEKSQVEKSKEEKDLEALEKYVMDLFNEPYVNARIRKQINDFVNNYHYTYSGIHKSLIYFFEVKGNSLEKANGGIGIVPFIYKDAYNYFYSLWQAQQSNKNKVLSDYVPKIREISIYSPERKSPPLRLFNLDEDEGEETNE